MQNLILKITVISTLLILLTACSKKTTSQANTTSQNQPQKEQARQQRGERPQFADLLTKSDSNNDGKLSLAEVKGPLKNDFSKIDKDKDGFITESEFKAAPKPQRRGRK